MIEFKYGVFLDLDLQETMVCERVEGGAGRSSVTGLGWAVAMVASDMAYARGV